MCGICGQLNFQAEHHVDRDKIECMMSSLDHRGPDSRGSWISEAIGLGHTRLAVIDLSESAHQPMSNEDGTVWIVYNGEIYNFPELREELESKGHHFRSKSDTEVIVHLYEEDGIECVRRLRGMFAFGLWDAKLRQLLLVRDRLGQKPLYYCEDQEKILFASEIKSLLASGLIEKSPDYEALYEYLYLGYVPHPGTGFAGIRKLPPGHRLIVRDRNLHIESYWSQPEGFTHGNGIGEEDARQRLKEILREAIEIRMVSDVPVGILLSGGIDSGAIAAMASGGGERIKTFTIGFEDKLYDERSEARSLADRLGTDHHELVVMPDVVDLLPRLARAYDEPFADPSAVPSYCLAQMAREHVTVVLNGDGGDESFAGYGTYIQAAMGKRTRRIPARLGLILSRLLADDRPGKRQSLSEVLALSGRSDAEIFSLLRLSSARKEIESLLDYVPGAANPSGKLMDCYRELYKGDMVNAMLAVDRKTFLPDDLLFKIDIATMCHSLEARSPFLDHHLVEFAASLPGWMKLNGMNKKYILKQALKEVLPAEVIARPKRGFDVPVGSWLRGELRELALDMLPGSSSGGQFLRKEKVEKLLNRHMAEERDYGRLIWTLLMLELWWHECLGN